MAYKTEELEKKDERRDLLIKAYGVPESAADNIMDMGWGNSDSLFDYFLNAPDTGVVSRFGTNWADPNTLDGAGFPIINYFMPTMDKSQGFSKNTAINSTKNNEINIGTAGGMTRLSTGYTFLNIQEHSKYIRENLEKIKNKKKYTIGKKYHFLDEIFIRVLKDNPKLMPEIFFKMFEVESKKVINFLSNKSNLLEDISVILKMPKIIFIKALFK